MSKWIAKLMLGCCWLGSFWVAGHLEERFILNGVFIAPFNY